MRDSWKFSLLVGVSGNNWGTFCSCLTRWGPGTPQLPPFSSFTKFFQYMYLFIYWSWAGKEREFDLFLWETATAQRKMNHKALLMEGMGRGELWAAAIPQGLGDGLRRDGRGVSRPMPQGSDGRHAVGQMSLCVRGFSHPLSWEEAHLCNKQHTTAAYV